VVVCLHVWNQRTNDWWKLVSRLEMPYRDGLTSVVQSIAKVDDTAAQNPPLVHRWVVPCLHQANCIVMSGRGRTACLQIVWCFGSLCSGFGLIKVRGTAILACPDRLEFDIWQDPNVSRFTISFLIGGSRNRLDVEHAVEIGGRHLALLVVMCSPS